MNISDMIISLRSFDVIRDKLAWLVTGKGFVSGSTDTYCYLFEGLYDAYNKGIPLYEAGDEFYSRLIRAYSDKVKYHCIITCPGNKISLHLNSDLSDGIYICFNGMLVSVPKITDYFLNLDRKGIIKVINDSIVDVNMFSYNRVIKKMISMFMLLVSRGNDNNDNSDILNLYFNLNDYILYYIIKIPKDIDKIISGKLKKK
jgi:hypothetical protein